MPLVRNILSAIRLYHFSYLRLEFGDNFDIGLEEEEELNQIFLLKLVVQFNSVVKSLRSLP